MITHTRPIFFLIVVFWFSLASAQNYTSAQGRLKTTELSINGHTVVAELAQTPEQRERGLMYRAAKPDGDGMLFVFKQAQPLSFWMKNTPSPLSIAFIDAQGTILNIRDMAPNDEKTQHPSKGAALYTLEVRQGWFSENKIKAGAVVKGLPGPAKQ